MIRVGGGRYLGSIMHVSNDSWSSCCCSSSGQTASEQVWNSSRSALQCRVNGFLLQNHLFVSVTITLNPHPLLPAAGEQQLWGFLTEGIIASISSCLYELPPHLRVGVFMVIYCYFGLCLLFALFKVRFQLNVNVWGSPGDLVAFINCPSSGALQHLVALSQCLNAMCVVLFVIK